MPAFELRVCQNKACSRSGSKQARIAGTGKSVPARGRFWADVGLPALSMYWVSYRSGTQAVCSMQILKFVQDLHVSHLSVSGGGCLGGGMGMGLIWAEPVSHMLGL